MGITRLFSGLLNLTVIYYDECLLSLIAIATLSIFMSHRPKIGKASWDDHLRRLGKINVIAVLIFAISMTKVLSEYKVPLDKLRLIELSMPLLGLVMSLTYFFGFLGVNIVSWLMYDKDDYGLQSHQSTIISPSKVPEIAVIGGGCCGCTVALAMAKKGRKVVLVERDLSYQDRIVGELLQPGGIRALERLGIDECAKENVDSVHVDGYVIIDPLSKTPEPKFQILKYPHADPSTFLEYFGYTAESTLGSKNNTDGNLKRPCGRSFHHGRFVQRLREKCLEHPNIEVIEANVTKLLEDDKGRVIGIEYKKKPQGSEEHQTGQVFAPLTMIADGIWSSMRKSMSDTVPTQASSFVGIVVDHPSMQAPVPYPHHGHVILADPSPCLIYQISSTETRVLVDILGPLPSTTNGEMQDYLRNKVAPQMPEGFRPAFLEAVASKEVKSMPNRFFPAKPPLKRGAFLIGDALNMRHPLTGGGMTVAIRDSETLSNLIGDRTHDLSDWDAMQAKYSEFLSVRRNYASTINVLANALHAVFSAPPGNPLRQSLRQACFDYLSMGGPYAAGPIGLLSGLTPKPEILATHFFMVALFGVKQSISSGLSGESLQRTHNLMRIACTIILPLLQLEQTTLLSWPLVRSLAFTLFPPISLSD